MKKPCGWDAYMAERSGPGAQSGSTSGHGRI